MSEIRYVEVTRRRRPNHILHLLLSLVTLGFWLPVWLLLSIFMGGSETLGSKPRLIMAAVAMVIIYIFTR
jgi:hypothetical protein